MIMIRLIVLLSIVLNVRIAQAMPNLQACEIDDIEAAVTAAEDAYYHEWYEETVRLMTCVLELETDNPDHYALRGKAYYWLNESFLAKEDFTAALEIEERGIYYAYRWASTRGAIFIDDDTDYFADLDRAIALDPDNAEVWLMLAYGSARGQQEITERQDERYGMALQVAETDAERARILTLRGTNYQVVGRYEDALQDFEEAVALDPDDLRIQVSLASLYLSMDNLEAAEATIQAVIEADPNFPRANVIAGMVTGIQGNIEESLTYYDRAIDKVGTRWGAMQERGIAHMLLGDYPAAVDDLTAVIEDCEQNNAFCAFSSNITFIYDVRGLAYTNMGRYEEALADRTTVLERDPNYDNAYFSLGFIYEQMGDIEQAKDWYAQYIDRIDGHMPQDIETYLDAFYARIEAEATAEPE